MISTLRSLLAALACLLALPAFAAFTDNGDGTVTDTVTGLMWKRCAQGQNWNGTTCADTAVTYSWANALAQAKNETYPSGGHTDWRLPNKNELESLVKIDTSSPAIDTTAFPATPSSWFWTSTTYAPDSAYACFVSFYHGDTDWSYKTSTNLVQLVRSGQLFGSFDSQLGITYSATTFTEVAANDGSINTSITLTLTGDTYVADVVSANRITASNVPAGLTANFVRTSGTVITATLTGNATAHANANDIANLTFTFADGAFTTTATAANVNNYTKNNLIVDFADPDTTPEAFSFTDQTNVARSTSTESNAIAVADIDSAAAITIADGDYEINASGTWTNAPGTVNNGNTVKVRHTSSGSYSTTVNTVLTIGGVTDTFSTTTLAAPAPDPDPAPAPEPTPAPAPAPAPDPIPAPPPAPTAVTITGPGQTVIAVPDLPIRIAPGANVDGTRIDFPASSPIVLELGGVPLTITPAVTGAQLTLHTLSLGGQSGSVISISSGSVNIESQSAGQYLFVFGRGQPPVQSGDGTTRFTAQRNGNGIVLIVRQGSVVLPAASFASSSTRRATSAEFHIHAGETATVDAAGRVTQLVLGTDGGSAAGDPLTLSLPANLSIDAHVPRLDARVERLGKTLQQAIATAAGGRVEIGQSNGVLDLTIAGQRLYALPLGEVTIDPTAPDGVALAADGTALVTLQGVRVTLAPSVAFLGRLASDLAAVLPDATLSITANGLIVAESGDTRYVVRPDWLAPLDTAAATGFGHDAAGRLRYQQNLRSFTLHPAFADFAKLSAAVKQALPGATATTNPEGTVTVTAGEQRWTLTPLYTTEAAPTGKPAWWADANGQFWLKNGDGTMQAFGIE